jgi:twitching motility two-component system response regulator PilH
LDILVIEDSPFLRAGMQRTLTKAGYAVTGVADGIEGLKVARASLPSVILLDMMLPGLDGTSVLKALKHDPATAQIPVIVLTGLSQRNESKLKEAGAARFIEKSTLRLEKNTSALIQFVEMSLRTSSKSCGTNSAERKHSKRQATGESLG